MVLSGMQEGIALEMAKLLEMLRMDEMQLLDFLTGQLKAGTRFGGKLFDVLRSAYARAGSESLQKDILQFLKSYADFSSTAHLEKSMMQILGRMTDAMPARWTEQLRDMMAQLENSFAAGDRRGSLQLLQKGIYAYMSRYVEQTHDVGLPRQLATLLALNIARYENGSPERMQEYFHQLRGYGTLKNQLGMMDDEMLMKLLEQPRVDENSSATRFAQTLAEAASRALRGEGSQQVQQGFQNLMAAMLINESVYMPINHYLLPLEWDGRMLFSEMWVDPDAEKNAEGAGGGAQDGNVVRILLKVDVQSVGLFDIVLTSQKENVDIQIACPAAVVPVSKQIEQAVTQILTRNELKPLRVAVRKMEHPVALTDVFPKIFQGRNSVNVKA